MYSSFCREFILLTPISSIVKDAVTLAWIRDSYNSFFVGNLLDELDKCANNAPAKESPHPVGSIIFDVGNAGSSIVVSPNKANTPSPPFLIIKILRN